MIRIAQILTGLLLLAWAMPVEADQAKKAYSAKIGIRVIYAVKEKTSSVDPALEDIKGELKELPFTKFRLLDKLSTEVGMKSTVELQFAGKRSISVRFLGLKDAKGKKMLSLQLAMKPTLKIQLRVADGGRTLLVGPSHQEGKLILDVSAKLKENGP
jgi:hypothetical protein